MLRHSRLWQDIQDGQPLKDPIASFSLAGGRTARISPYIVGDSGYICMPEIITPYPGAPDKPRWLWFAILSRARSVMRGPVSTCVLAGHGSGWWVQRKLNYCHSSTRMVVERTFGQSKGRWRLLSNRVNKRDPKEITKLIVAGCILHNLCVRRRDHIDDRLNPVRLQEVDSVSASDRRDIIRDASDKQDTIADWVVNYKD